MPNTMQCLRATAAGALILAGCGDEPTAVAPPPVPTPCPTGVSTQVTCYTGKSLAGVTYLIGMPTNWNRILVVVNRGATPVALTEPRFLGAARNLMRDGGLAIAASAYRSATPLASQAAEDSEELRQIFVANFGPPRRTVALGLSLGGLVAARCAEMYRTFDGVLSACGLVAGTLRSWYPQIDLRTVYQYYCRNLPRQDEKQYDLFLGLEPQTIVTSQLLQERVNECTGILLPVTQRSALQRSNLANILGVLRFPESGLLAYMEAATFILNNFVQGTLGGRNPFPNTSVRYAGSTDDDALNRGVPRYGMDSRASAEVAAADDPTGRVTVPVITLHAIDDPRAFVENQAAYRETFTRAGTLNYLFQTYTNQGAHCMFTVPEQLGVLETLLTWIETRTKPTIDAVMTACEKYRAEFGGTCRFAASYQPAPLASRVYSRQP